MCKSVKVDVFVPGRREESQGLVSHRDNQMGVKEEREERKNLTFCFFSPKEQYVGLKTMGPERYWGVMRLE